MEENYLLAKSVVDEKFNKDNEYYYMFICALFGFFMKYPDHKELIINSFKDTNIIIEDISVLEMLNEQLNHNNDIYKKIVVEKENGSLEIYNNVEIEKFENLKGKTIYKQEYILIPLF